MSNLVSYVMQFLTPDMVGRMASALGLNRSDAQSGVTAAVPALLAAFAGLADKPGGPQSLVNTIKQQSGVVDNFASVIGGNNQASFIERGSSLLTSLLGSHDSASLANAVGRSAGLGQTRATSMLGMLAPLVMGLIAKQMGPRGIDVGSLTSLLASQKDNIAQMLPAGMGQMLEASGLLGEHPHPSQPLPASPPLSTSQPLPSSQPSSQPLRSTGMTGSRGNDFRSDSTRSSDQYRTTSNNDQYRSTNDQYRASNEQFRQQYPTSRPVERTVREEPGVPNWVYWLLPLLVLGGLLWYLLGRPHEQQQARQEPPPPPVHQEQRPVNPPQTTGQATPNFQQQQPQQQTQAQPTTGNVMVGGVDVKNTLGDSLSDLRTSLGGITDPSSAQAALPKIEAARNQIDRVSSLAGQLSTDQRRTLAGVVATALPGLSQMSDRVMGIPGVGDILRSQIDPMKSKLAELSGIPATTGAGR